MENLSAEDKAAMAKVNNSGDSIRGFLGAIFFIASLVFAILGTVKLFNYDTVKTLVNGDAYNFIIHSNITNGYFLISILLMLMALFCVQLGIYANTSRK